MGCTASRRYKTPPPTAFIFPRVTTPLIAIIGAGRLGSALAGALRAAGAPVIGPLRRGETNAASGAEMVLLCVPDAEIAGAARSVVPGPLVGHCSGATSLDPLAPHERFSLHPLISVTRDGASFIGAGCAVAGSTPRALAAAMALAGRLGMHAFVVAEEDRPLYHAAASVASNYLVTLQAMAEHLAALAGVSREHITPLALGAVRQAVELGPRDALTGPIARGDVETVAWQRTAVATRAPDLLPLWDALADATRALAATARESHA